MASGQIGNAPTALPGDADPAMWIRELTTRRSLGKRLVRPAPQWPLRFRQVGGIRLDQRHPHRHLRRRGPDRAGMGLAQPAAARPTSHRPHPGDPVGGVRRDRRRSHRDIRWGRRDRAGVEPAITLVGSASLSVGDLRCWFSLIAPRGFGGDGPAIALNSVAGSVASPRSTVRAPAANRLVPPYRAAARGPVVPWSPRRRFGPLHQAVSARPFSRPPVALRTRRRELPAAFLRSQASITSHFPRAGRPAAPLLTGLQRSSTLLHDHARHRHARAFGGRIPIGIKESSKSTCA